MGLTQLGHMCGAWTDLSGDPVSVRWGGHSLPSISEIFANPLSYMKQAPPPVYLLLIVLQPTWDGPEKPGSFKCVPPQLMLLQHILSEAMPLSAILTLYLTSFQSKAFF